MNESRSEYLPANANGANGNGNGNGKIFGLVKTEDPLAQVVPAARRRVCENTSIPESARMFFCWLTDMSLLFGVYMRRGVVKFADSYLSRRFGVSQKTIQNWRAAVISTGEVWVTEMKMKNSFPQTVYNVSCIIGAQMPLPLAIEGNDGSLPEDLIFTSNRRRLAAAGHDKSTGKFVCRTHGQPSCPICRAQRTPPRVRSLAIAASSIEKAQENEPSRKILPSTTAIDCRAPRQMVAAHHGNELPQPTANGCRPARQTVAVHHGNELPLSTANGCRSARKDVAEKGEAKDVSLSHSEATFKRSTALNALKGAGRAKKIDSENEFLSDVADMMHMWKPGSFKEELANSGAWWRMSYRASADLIQRVLAETRVAVKEGRIKTTPGQYAVDLWKRWSLDLLKEKTKTAAGAAARA